MKPAISNAEEYRQEYAIRVEGICKQMTDDTGTWPSPLFPSPLGMATNEPMYPTPYCDAEVQTARVRAWRIVFDTATRKIQGPRRLGPA